MSDIDKHLNRYATDLYETDYKWWWNGDTVIASALASACQHLRLDGTTYFSVDELQELQKMECYFTGYADSDSSLFIDKHRWLHAEAMWLLGQWFHRLWD